MIFTDRTITVQKGTSSLDETVVLYRGDKEVEIRFTLNEKVPFKFGSGTDSNIIEKAEAAYGQLVIKTPNDLPSIFSEIVPTNEGKIILTITAEMIDEITELGNYTFQIRLFDESRNSRATLPEVVNGIEIREPIATEDVTTTNEVGVATVGYAMTTAGTSEDAFDSQGNYNKTTWAAGDRITAAKLNKIEAGIDGVNTTGTGSNNASDISITDTGNYFTATDIEGALQEAGSQIKDIKNSINNKEYFILQSPNGTQYRVTVNDNGELKAIDINTEGLTDLLAGRLLVWHDEFDNSQLDLNKWRYATHNSGGSEIQAYTIGRSENVRIEDNSLVLEAKKDNYVSGYNWSSGRIDTCGLAGFKYGRIEAKLKYDVVSGAFPAFWTIGTCAYYPTGEDIHGIQYSKGTQWAQNGELDVFEGRGTNTTISQGGWYNQDDGKGNMSMEFGHKDGVDASQYHIYAIEWTETTITSYIDGVETGTKDISNITPWNRPHYLILNMAVGSTGGTPADNCTSMKMYVDWVRVYAPASVTQKIDVTGINLDTTGLNFNIGDNPIDVYYTVTPSTAWDNNVNYETTNTAVATVYGSRVYPMGVGNCNLIARSSNGVTTQIPIVVAENLDIPSTQITIANTDISFNSGTTYQINATALPTNHTDTIKYSSDNTSVATVDENTGLVTGVSGGTCKIKAYSSLNSTVYDEVQITVIQRVLLTGIPTDGLTLQLDRNGMSSTSWTNAIDNRELVWKVVYDNSTDISSYMVYDGASFYWAGANYLDHLTLDGFNNYYDFGESQTIIIAGDFTNAANPILSNQSNIGLNNNIAKLNFHNLEYKDSSGSRIGILSFKPTLQIDGAIALRYNKDTYKVNLDRMAFTDTELTSSTATLSAAFTQGTYPALLGSPSTSKIYYKLVLAYNRVLTDEEVQTAITAIKTFLNS